MSTFDPARSLTRRDAMRLLGIGAAGFALGGYRAQAAGYPANETLNVGLIGCGGRMRGRLMPALREIPGVRIVAVCDVYDAFANSAHVQAGGRERDVLKTRHHEDVLARKDVDAVIIATPDHWHAPITIEAMQAGKDVFVEKPLTHKLEEGARLLEAQRRTGRIVQVGAQQRTMPHLVVLKQKLDSGEIRLGKVNRIHMQWCRNPGPYPGDPTFRITEGEVDWRRFLGNSPRRPFDPLRLRDWRWFWDYGCGPLGDLMVHWLDTVNWLFDLPMPRSVVASGGIYHRKGRTETPDLATCLMEYPDLELQMGFVSSWSNNFQKACTIVMGREATLYFDRGRYEVVPQGRNEDPVAEPSDSFVASEGERGADFFNGYDGEALHLGDWMAAIRERREPADPISAGVQAAAVCHHGNLSYRRRRFIQL